MNFCSHCGAPVTLRIPAGDDHLRYTCDSCGAIHYQNPKVVVGCIPHRQGRILLCRRAIEPRYGRWTLPAGYLENGETLAEGARRETQEEAGAVLGELIPYGLYNICHVNQIYLMFRAQLHELDFAPGTESLEVRLFAEYDIPWTDLAFPVIERTLARYVADRTGGNFSFHIEDIVRRMGQPSAESG
ncbi:MAG: NUDIX hydrolase [Desulfobacterales bacterium]